MLKSHVLVWTFPLIAMAIGSGCSSIIDAHSQKTELMTVYDGGNLQAAMVDVGARSESRKDSGDAVMWFLEEGAIRFDSGEYEKSIHAFDQAEQKISDYDHRASVSTRDVGAEAGSAITNLNALPYKGMFYDRILLNGYKALDYFMLGKPDDARVELRRMRDMQNNVVKLFQAQIDQEQKEIAKDQAELQKDAPSLNLQTQAAPKDQKPKSSYDSAKSANGEKEKKEDPPISTETIMDNEAVKAAMTEAKQKSEKTYGNLANPFATYLSAIGYLYERNTSEALVDLRNLYRMEKSNPLTNRDYVTIGRQLGEALPEELKSVQPYPYSLTSNVVYVIFANGRGPALKQTKLQIILPWVGYTGIAFPQYEYYKATYTGMRVTADGQAHQSVLVADMDNVASQEYVNRLPVMITRIVISYLTKEAASLVATQAASSQGIGMAIVAYGATGIYKYLFNTADTRCWETIPKEYQLVHLPIPADRKITITPLAGTMTEQSINVELKKSTRFAIVYVRGGSSKILTQKVIELE